MEVKPNPIRVCFCSSAYNEESSLLELYLGCLEAISQANEALGGGELQFSMALVDNCSTDQTPELLRKIVRSDSRVKSVRNRLNYGPEPAFALALRLSSESDIVVMLCADLQDPPQHAADMLKVMLIEESTEQLDGILGVKTKSAGNRFIRSGRKLYYKLLSFSDRDVSVPSGFHGFGCYTQRSINNALHLWDSSPMNLRSCLAASCMNYRIYSYDQPQRHSGKSSYTVRSYVSEAASAIYKGKSLASRISLGIAAGGFLITTVVACLIIANYLTGKSGYAGGIPSLAVLILLASSTQALILSLLSRQVEMSQFTRNKGSVFYERLD